MVNYNMSFIFRNFIDIFLNFLLFFRNFLLICIHHSSPKCQRMSWIVINDQKCLDHSFSDIIECQFVIAPSSFINFTKFLFLSTEMKEISVFPLLCYIQISIDIGKTNVFKQKKIFVKFINDDGIMSKNDWFVIFYSFLC